MTTPNLTGRTLLGPHADALYGAAPLEHALVHHGALERLSAITDIAVLRDATAVLDAWDGEPKTARAWSPAGSANPFEFMPTRGQLRTLYDAGFTVVLEDVERFVPALRPLCHALERDLGVAPGKVNAEVFCGRAGGHGRPHFDPSFTFNAQIAGDKAWRIAPNPALRFPPTGMFLGRLPEAELAALLERPMPATIDDTEAFVATPGTVVFLPPGVLHETRMQTDSFAVAFAIEFTDTVARRVAERVRRQLDRVPELRAARLGAQGRAAADQAAAVASALRGIADALEHDAAAVWSGDEPLYRLRPGLLAEPVSATAVALSGERVRRTVELDAVMVDALRCASTIPTLTLAELVAAAPLHGSARVDEALRKLAHLGLLERVSTSALEVSR
jgi:hypothetical protein